MFFDKLFQSDGVKNAAFGMVKKMMNEEKIKYLVIQLKPDGELDMQRYSFDQDPVIMGKENVAAIEFAANELQKSLDEANGAIDTLSVINKHLAESNSRLVEINGEQERAIKELTEENKALWKAAPVSACKENVNPENDGTDSNGAATA